MRTDRHWLRQKLVAFARDHGLKAAARALGSDHRYIPPKRYTWQSDVETVHRLVEDEFFDRETFTGPADFWRKVTTYWHYFNLVRPNRGKEWQSPLQILEATAPALAGAVLNWVPLNLSRRHHFYLPLPTTGVTMSPDYPKSQDPTARAALLQPRQPNPHRPGRTPDSKGGNPRPIQNPRPENSTLQAPPARGASAVHCPPHGPIGRSLDYERLAARSGVRALPARADRLKPAL